MLRTCSIYDFPFFCGAVVGGYTFLQIPLRHAVTLVARYLQPQKWRNQRNAITMVSRFLAALCSASLFLGLLNKPKAVKGSLSTTEVRLNVTLAPLEHKGQLEKAPVPLAGKSMDLTLFAVSRAIDTVVNDLWTRRKRSRILRNHWTAVDQAVSRSTDALVFATSAGVVMWAWFYLPDRLPRAYNDWIKSAAQVDERLIEALRRARYGELIYGEDTGQASLLQSMCKDYNWPMDWGNPAKVFPIPCEMVHMGTGPSCHWHAIVRFAKAFRFALAMYLPLQLLIRAPHPSFAALQKACKEAARSSAFLGAFVALFYYGVCLSRTRLGPKIISKNTITPMMWDSGLCVRAGCLLCGWSILVEAEKRRQELALFVVPRAAATLFPRRYPRQVSQRLDHDQA